MIIINAKEYSAKEVRKIEEKYYIIGETCFKIGGKWRSTEDPEVAYDVTKKEYNLKKNLTYGIISPESWGYFTPTFMSIDSEVGYYLNYNDCPLKLSAVGKKVKNHKQTIQKIANLSYNFDLGIPYIKDLVEFYKKKEIHVTSEVKNLSSLLKGYTFGIEYETCNGTIPYYFLSQIGLIPLKDGSLRLNNGAEPFEYVTPPISGIRGVQTILDQCSILTDCCSYDRDCSLHIHIGGIRNDRRVLVALYKLVYMLQQELYDLAPYGKRDPEYFYGEFLKSGDKRKNYARLLPDLPGENIGEMLQSMFRLFSNNIEISKEYTRGNQHYEKNKWNRWNRYSIVNFEHLLLGQSNTIEFRIFSMTTNGQKVVNLLLICLAIVRYAEAYSNQIIQGHKVSLKDVVLGYQNDFGTTSGNANKNLLAEYLNSFVNDCKKTTFIGACSNDSQLCHQPEYLFQSNYKLAKDIAHLPIPVCPLVQNTDSAPTNRSYEEILEEMFKLKAKVFNDVNNVVEYWEEGKVPHVIEEDENFDLYADENEEKEINNEEEIHENVPEAVPAPNVEIQKLEYQF